jgi:hypothetical protein
MSNELFYYFTILLFYLLKSKTLLFMNILFIYLYSILFYIYVFYIYMFIYIFINMKKY